MATAQESKARFITAGLVSEEGWSFSLPLGERVTPLQQKLPVLLDLFASTSAISVDLPAHTQPRLQGSVITHMFESPYLQPLLMAGFRKLKYFSDGATASLVYSYKSFISVVEHLLGLRLGCAGGK